MSHPILAIAWWLLVVPFLCFWANRFWSARYVGYAVALCVIAVLGGALFFVL